MISLWIKFYQFPIFIDFSAFNMIFVHNNTKFKIVGMLIEKYKDSKLDNLNQIELVADDVLRILAICGI